MYFISYKILYKIHIYTFNLRIISSQMHTYTFVKLIKSVYYLLFTILRPFGTRESIRWKVDHGGQIVLWYWQHATNLARVTMFVVYMSAVKVLVWVRGKVEQKHSLTFCDALPSSLINPRWVLSYSNSGIVRNSGHAPSS